MHKMCEEVTNNKAAAVDIVMHEQVHHGENALWEEFGLSAQCFWLMSKLEKARSKVLKECEIE